MAILSIDTDLHGFAVKMKSAGFDDIFDLIFR